MTFDVQEYRQFIELVYKHPEWRVELRQLVLTEELLTLPDLVRELAEAQKRTEQRVEELAEAQKRTEQRVEELAEAQKRTEQRVEELAEAQKRSEERITRLEQAIAELAEAQKRTEQRVEELAEAQKRTEERITRLEQAIAELAEAQKRTEQRVEELAEVQKRSEERITRLEQVVAELAEAQKRTEQRVEELAEAQRRTGVAVGAFQRVIGVTVEEEAASVAEVVLRRKGYRILQPAFSLALDGEIDVVLPLEDPSGRQIWTVLEAKARLSGRDVHAWAQRMREPSWHQRLANKGCSGPYLVYAYGIRIDLSAQEAAQKEGIGLIKSDGEVLAPVDLIESLADKNEA